MRESELAIELDILKRENLELKETYHKSGSDVSTLRAELTKEKER